MSLKAGILAKLEKTSNPTSESVTATKYAQTIAAEIVKLRKMTQLIGALRHEVR